MEGQGEGGGRHGVEAVDDDAVDVVVGKIPQELDLLGGALDPQHVVKNLEFVGGDPESQDGDKQLDAALGEVVLLVLEAEGEDEAEGQLLALHVDGVLGLEADLVPDLGLVELPRPPLLDHHQEYLQQVRVGRLTAHLELEQPS